MKKKLFTAFAVFALALVGISESKAQDVFDQGRQFVNIGIGIPDNSYSSVTIPPLSVSYDYAIASGLIDGRAAVGLGAEFEVYNFKVDNSKSNQLALAARGSFHYQLADKLDTYAFLTAGLERIHIKGSDSDTDFQVNLGLGARYFFTPTTGAFAEIGSGISVIKAGVTFAF